MKKSLDLKETRSDLVSKLEGVHSLATSEKRELTKDETKKVDSFLTDIDALDVNIKRAEKIESELRSAAAVSGASVSQPKADKRYSIQKAVQGYMNHNLTGIEKEYDQEARRNNTITGVGIPMMAMEQRTAQSTSTASGMIPTEVGAFAETLQNKTVLGDWATWMYGLSGDMKLPTLSGTSASWSAEASAPGSDAGTTVGSATLQPKKLSAYMDISKMLLAQTNGSVENIIRNDIQNAIASNLEAAVLGIDAGASNTPEGVYNAGTEAATAAAFTRNIILDIIKDFETANADFGRVGFIGSPAAKEMLRKLAGDVITTSGASTPLWAMDDKIMGYTARSTGNSHIKSTGTYKTGLVLGKWDDCVIGQFGSALDVVVDPYTLANKGEVRLVVLSFWDVIYRRATSFQYFFGS
jgi:HK97 family phage major capsid protein